MLIHAWLQIIVLYSTLSITYGTEDCEPCPGFYCGRTKVSNESNCNLKCLGCNRGYRTDGYFCQKCNEDLVLYDWLFLGFMMLCVTVLNFYAIDAFHASHKRVWYLHLSALLESVIAFICTILLFEPVGTLQIHTCGVKSINDWYTVFFNPKTNHLSKIHCTQEAVYPLYTSIFIYLLLTLLIMIILRGIFSRLFMNKFGRSPLYVGLYILPFVAVVHICFAGVIYYIYPYLTIFLSAVGVAIFLSTLDGDYFNMVRKPRHIGVLICYAVGHGYGIVSITEMTLLVRDIPVMLLIFLPFLFYTITRPFTNAENIVK